MSGRRRDVSARPTTTRMTSSPRSAPRDDAPSQVSPRTRPADDDSTDRHIRYNMTIDTQSPTRSRTSANADRVSSAHARRDSESAQGPLSPTIRRRSTRAATFKTVDGDDELDIELPFSSRPGWQPGSEPGYDPQLPDGGHATMPTPNANCQITVVDYSSDGMSKHHFGNQGFIEYLRQPKEDWVKCRWINVNGLSWDVIQAIGTEKGLHKLAIEDIMNLRNRTKADWYVLMDTLRRLGLFSV